MMEAMNRKFSVPIVSLLFIGAVIIAVILVSVALSLLVPLTLSTRVRIMLFQTLASVAGVLIGFIGIVGVYALDSIRSRIADNSKRIGQLQGEYRRLEPKLLQSGENLTWPVVDVTLITISFEVDALRKQQDRFVFNYNSAILVFFASVIFSLATIACAVLGISGADLAIPMLGWRVLLLVNFSSLFLSIFLTSLLAYLTTQSPAFKPVMDTS